MNIQQVTTDAGFFGQRMWQMVMFELDHQRLDWYLPFGVSDMPKEEVGSVLRAVDGCLFDAFPGGEAKS